jgi:ribosome biogenesis GTPase / thiamine phosphate phosphatase
MLCPIFDLRAIGATADVFAQFQPYAGRGLTLGRVTIAHGARYRIYTSAGEASAEPIGALLYRAPDAAALPVTGDWVSAQLIDDGAAMIHDVLPRRTIFSRRAAGNREQEQVLAANIDLAIVVCGLDGDFNTRRLERYLIAARESGADVAIALNKTDLCADLAARLAAAERVARGTPVLAVCALEPGGVEPMRALLRPGRTLALLGSSGAGKSTLANQLLGEARQRVREVRIEDSRGRHTTTHRELIPLPGGGALIDTPGLRELRLWAGPESLDSSFEDIEEMAQNCRFRDCAHAAEDGCAVRAAIAGGRLDEARLESYRKLKAEIAWHARRLDIRAAIAEKQRWKRIHKAMRNCSKEDRW